MENARDKKRRDKTMAALEQDIPDLVKYCARDLKFLNTIVELVRLEDEQYKESLLLVEQAWRLDQAGYSFNLSIDRFLEDLMKGAEYIASENFEEYNLRFGRYLED